MGIVLEEPTSETLCVLNDAVHITSEADYIANGKFAQKQRIFGSTVHIMLSVCMTCFTTLLRAYIMVTFQHQSE